MVPGASRQGARDWGQVAVNDLVVSTALLLMLGLRAWLHKPMCASRHVPCRATILNLCNQQEPTLVFPNPVPDVLVLRAVSSASSTRCGWVNAAQLDDLQEAHVTCHPAA